MPRKNAKVAGNLSSIAKAFMAWLTQMNREIITIQAGQCGNSSMSLASRLLSLEKAFGEARVS